MGAKISYLSEVISQSQLQSLLGELYSDELYNILRDIDGNISKKRIIELSKRTDCFLSHDRGVDELGRQNNLRVEKINEALKRKGLITWFDTERMEGHIAQQMSDGIDRASVILVFVTRRYNEKVAGNKPNDNCKLEFDYAQLRKLKVVVPIVMEPRLLDTSHWKGPVGMALGNLMNFNFSYDELLDQVVDQIYDRIIRLSATEVELNIPDIVKEILQTPERATLSFAQASQNNIPFATAVPRRNQSHRDFNVADVQRDVPQQRKRSLSGANKEAKVEMKEAIGATQPFAWLMPSWAIVGVLAIGIALVITAYAGRLDWKQGYYRIISSNFTVSSEAFDWKQAYRRIMRTNITSHDLFGVSEDKADQVEVHKDRKRLEALNVREVVALLSNLGFEELISVVESEGINGEMLSMFDGADIKELKIENMPNIRQKLFSKRLNEFKKDGVFPKDLVVQRDVYDSYLNVKHLNTSSAINASDYYYKMENHLGAVYSCVLFKQGFRVAHESKVCNGTSVAYVRDALAVNGNPFGQHAMGLLYLYGLQSASDNVAEAVKWLQKSAENDIADAQALLGNQHELGKGSKIVNYDEAVKWYRPAAAQDHLGALYRLGLMYLEGRGVTKNKAEGIRLLKRAGYLGHVQAAQRAKGEQGDAATQNTIGIDLDLAGKYDEAVKWYRRAADQGNKYAQHNLGLKYRLGQGVAQSDEIAVELFTLSAKQGHKEAQSFLGWMYEHGYGVAKNDEEAIKWYKASSVQGHQEATDFLNTLLQSRSKHRRKKLLDQKKNAVEEPESNE